MVEGQLRRYDLFLAQVGFLVGDLRRKMGSYALHWRRSPPFFLTCAKIPIHLHHVVGKVNRNYWTMSE